jgi:amino acid adenylation domain-containing protein
VKVTSKKKSIAKSIHKDIIHDILTLTPMQEGMLFHFLKDPKSDFYFEQLSLEISGKINVLFFKKAWNFVVQSNEMLRTVFRWEKMKSPIQMILKEYPLQWTFYDLSIQREKDKHLKDIKHNDIIRNVDMQEVPFRVTLCKTNEFHIIMMLSYHHILLDGWSLGIILKEFFSAYGDLCNGNPLKKPLKTKFKEFIQWHQQQDQEKEAGFWQSYLEAIEPGGGLQLTKTSNDTTAKQLNQYYSRLEQEDTKNLGTFINDQKTTWASLLYLGWGLLLQIYCNRDDVIFGTTVSGRSAKIPGIENMVGLFINTLPLRIKSQKGDTVEDSLTNLYKDLLTRKDFEHTPLVKINQYNRNNSNEELFDSLLIVENYPLDIKSMQESSALSIQSYNMIETTHYHLTLTCQISEHIDIQFSYHSEVFTDTFIHQLSSHYLRMLHLISHNPGLDIAKLELLSDQEKKRLLELFNDTDIDYPKDKTLQELCEQKAQMYPHLTAIIGTAADSHKDIIHLSYNFLNKRANQLAFRLKSKGVLPGSIVAINMPRSIDMLITMLGILKTGAAYLPIDPEYPHDRIDYMLQDSNARGIIIGKSESQNSNDRNNEFPVWDLSLLDLEFVSDFGFRASDLSFSSSLAYVIYTSGSTGRPKGVMIQHNSVINFIAGMNGSIDFSQSQRVLALTTIAFDIFVLETWLPLTMGLQILIANETEQMDSRVLSTTIVRHKIDTLQMTPSRLKLIFTETESNDQEQSLNCLQGVKTLIVGGETFPAHLYRFLRQGYSGMLYNVYGPTETTVWSTVKELPRVSTEAITIGKPIANTGIYILNRFNRLQPIGIPGDLLIGGEGVARGYLNQPELTKEKFITSQPFHLPLPLYRTGDLARWLWDGNIQFLGRVDHQVKIRGFRIELEEIESLLLKYEHIKEALVMVKETKKGDQYLCAYVVAKEGNPELVKLRDYLSETLPAYSIPSFFVYLSEIPLTPNGKINRNALPEPEPQDTANVYETPGNQIEKALATVWTQILGEKEELCIGRNDHFFQLGGDSIKAIQVSSRLMKFGLDLQIKDLFAHPVIKDLAKYVRETDEKSKIMENAQSHRSIQSDIKAMKISSETFANIKTFIANQIPESPDIESLYPLNPTQKAMLHYSLMGANKEVYLIQNLIRWNSNLQHSHLETSLNKLVDTHDILRTVFIYEGLKEPLQVVLKHRKVHVHHENISHLPTGEQSEFLECIRAKEEKSGFDLSKDSLIKLSMFKLGEVSYTLLWTHHYILMDGWSLGLLFNQLLALLEQLNTGQNVTLNKTTPYGNYIHWLNRQDKTEALNYWQKYLHAYDPPQYLLPTKTNGVKESRGFSFTHYSFQLQQEESLQINRLSALSGVTVNTFFQTLWGVILQKRNNRSDVVFGAVVSGRPPKITGIEEMLGLFIGTVPIRITAEQNIFFVQLLKIVQQNNMTSKPYEYLQFTEILSYLGLQGNIIDSLMTFQNFPSDSRFQNEDFEVDTFEQSNYNINIIIFPATATSPFRVKFIYNANYFGEEVIKEIKHHLKDIIGQILANKNIRLQDIQLSFDGEKADTQIFEEEDDNWLL